jgi:hypothetical protein
MNTFALLAAVGANVRLIAVNANNRIFKSHTPKVGYQSDDNLFPLSPYGGLLLT